MKTNADYFLFQLSYNWHFEIEKKDDPMEAAKLFCVPDFIGDMCKAIASQIRGAVSAVSFDDFHKNSAKIIRYEITFILEINLFYVGYYLGLQFLALMTVHVLARSFASTTTTSL